MDARRIRPLSQPPHPRRNRYIPTSSHATYRLASGGHAESSLISLLVLFEEKPLRWAFLRENEKDRIRFYTFSGSG